jgi:hypothetical protein
MKKPNLIISGLIGIAIYLIATGLSFVLFSNSSISLAGKPKPTPTPTGKTTQKHFAIDPSIPRTEPCPLNGQLYTKQELDIWKTRRPLAVMIENHAEARPQSGLSYADVIYEAVAEGGITRFMGVFYCGVAAENTLVAPVRSARTYFLPWVLEYDALYNHVGGAGNCNDDTVDDRAKALCQIGTYKIKNMDQFGLPFKEPDKSGNRVSVCFRNYDRLDHPVATEHTMVCDTKGLYLFATQEDNWTNVDEKGISWDKNFVSWKFKDDAKESDRGAGGSFSFVAWKGYENDYGVKWEYDKATNSYKRFNGGVAHTDLETKEQLTAKDVVIVFAKEIDTGDPHAHLLYNNIGSGDGMLYEDGKSIKITWKKADRNARTKFYDASGKEAQLNRGQIWIEMLPIGTPIN